MNIGIEQQGLRVMNALQVSQFTDGGSKTN
jgi:hypothetical protein